MNSSANPEAEPGLFCLDGYEIRSVYRVLLGGVLIGRLFYNYPPGNYTFRSVDSKLRGLESKAWPGRAEARMSIQTYATVASWGPKEREEYRKAKHEGTAHRLLTKTPDIVLEERPE